MVPAHRTTGDELILKPPLGPKPFKEPASPPRREVNKDLSLVFHPLCCIWVPLKACMIFLSQPHQFLLIKVPRTQVGNSLTDEETKVQKKERKEKKGKLRYMVQKLLKVILKALNPGPP